ncbi:MAG TPA: tetratricopeptide repeat protein [Candidatus Acidoferrales bacterium]
MSQPAKTRRQKLEEFVAAKPGDAFSRYGLAMECVNSGDAAAAEEHFRKLLASHPDYVAGYFHFGQLLAKLARTGEAREILSSGIAVAKKKGDDRKGNPKAPPPPVCFL